MYRQHDATVCTARMQLMQHVFVLGVYNCRREEPALAVARPSRCVRRQHPDVATNLRSLFCYLCENEYECRASLSPTLLFVTGDRAAKENS